MPDNLHPTAEGAGLLAQAVYGHLTGDFGGLRMPITYTDNMVLQCGKPLRIAGQANAGERVTVVVAGNKAQTIAAADGQWAVTLPSLNAGGPYTLTVTATSGRLTYQNVLAGEDMQPRWFTNDVEWDASVLDSLNRLQYFTDTQWTECNEQTVKAFSAVAHAFGTRIHLVSRGIKRTQHRSARTAVSLVGSELAKAVASGIAALLRAAIQPEPSQLDLVLRQPAPPDEGGAPYRHGRLQ